MKQCKRLSFSIEYNGTQIAFIAGVAIFVSNHFTQSQCLGVLEHHGRGTIRRLGNVHGSGDPRP